VDALIAVLVRQRAEDPTVKSVVVSQFTSFLTLLETPLRYSLIDLHLSNYSVIDLGDLLHTKDGLPARRRSPIQVLTGPSVD